MTYAVTRIEAGSESPSLFGAEGRRAPYRPVQYLGNKLRTLGAIASAARDLIGRTGHVADLFTGTTIVAQELAGRGYRVSAVDTQLYASIFARALLGIGRGAGESCAPATLARLGVGAVEDGSFAGWMPLIEREDRALRAGDAAALAAAARELPLIWRDPGHPLHRRVATGERRSAAGEAPLIASIHAGHYFGVGQAIAIDRLRQGAGRAKAEGKLSDWQYCAALTAIMAASSAAVHSAGKHFAQPLNAGSSTNAKFLAKRLLEDRGISVDAEFRAACAAINVQAAPADEGHAARRMPAEEFVRGADGRADLYYVDPPYTAQQYSRFYHVLETICTYEYPQLLRDGAATTGLYPAERYKSAFSSKTKAAGAFRELIAAAGAGGAAMLISYSHSAARSQGNARMISFEGLLELCRDGFGARNVDWHRLDHRYRQFNSASLSNAYRENPEIMIACRRR